jgi:hypothetical protein
MAAAAVLSATVVDPIKERLTSALEIVDVPRRNALRAVTRGGHAAEDAAAAASLIVRRRPLAAATIAACAGALAGAFIGFALGRFAR